MIGSARASDSKTFDESERLAINMIHEVMQLTANLPDHRGECSLCRFNDPKMLPLRYDMCDICTRQNRHFVHRDCVMSYACEDCMASRLNEFSSVSDMLCSECRSKVQSDEHVVARYFYKVNSAVSQEYFRKIFIDQNKLRFGFDLDFFGRDNSPK